ncbi:MAG: hypothetical protein V3R96_00695 [Dehalococcoidales bacterium]
MRVNKTYKEINPELLYSEIKDYILKQGVIIGTSKMETYSSASNSSSFTSRGTLTFNIQDKAGKPKGECISVHIVGSAREETKLMLDIDEKLFPQEKVSALQADLDFVFGSYEVKTPEPVGS